MANVLAAVMDALKAIADLKAAGLSEQQARAIVRAVEQARGDDDRGRGAVVSTRVASQEDVRWFRSEVSRLIAAESRLYVACMIGMFAAMYALLRLIP